MREMKMKSENKELCNMKWYDNLTQKIIRQRDIFNENEELQ